jgi:cation:H+ antiporter
MTYVLLVASFALLLGGALVFTNAVEWAGARMGLGTGAVGSLLAAVATALPESLVPIIALLSGSPESEEVAIGAIIGAPFLLGTLAMALVGVAAFGFKERREQDERLEHHRPTLVRDLVFFLLFLGAALVLGIVGTRPLRIAAAVLFVAGYAAYVWSSVIGGGESSDEEELAPLYVDPSKTDPPSTWQIVLQTAAGVAAIAFGAHLFVEEVTHLAESLGVTPLVLALVLAPVATELPEKFNSVIWMREGKDELALGNITGAMVFQSTLPVAVGLAFTSWSFDVYPILACAFALAGGALALWAGADRRRFGPFPVGAWAGLFVAFVLVVVFTAG